jgi:hypothetical protein
MSTLGRFVVGDTVRLTGRIARIENVENWPPVISIVFDGDTVPCTVTSEIVERGEIVAPPPFVVGDWVIARKPMGRGRILALHGDDAWVFFPNGRPLSLPLADLRRSDTLPDEDEKACG